MRFGDDPIILLKELADRARSARIMGRDTPERRAQMEEQFRSRMSFDAWVTISRLFQDLKDVEDSAVLTASRIADLHVSVDGERCKSGCTADPETGMCQTMSLARAQIIDLGRPEVL